MRALCFSFHETPYLSRFRVVKSGIYLLYGNVSLAPASSVLNSANQLPAGSVYVITTGGTNGGYVSALIEHRLEPSCGVHTRPFEIAFRERVERNKVNLARQAFQQGYQLPCMFRLIINAFDNRVFNSGLSFIRQPGQITTSSRQKFRNGILFIQWNQRVAQLIIGCMERDGQ